MTFSLHRQTIIGTCCELAGVRRSGGVITMRFRARKADAAIFELYGPLASARIPMTSLIQALTVAEFLSFGHAARRLGVSQSSVSTRIRALENEIGIALFDRNTRGVRLTEAGRHFVDQVGDALDIIDHAINTAGMLSRGEEGKLRVGVHALVSGGHLERLLARFHSKHPAIRLHITEGTARQAQLMVREGRLDVAFMALNHEIPDLSSRVIWRDGLMAALPLRHALATQPDVEWRQLAEETFLVRQDGTGPQVHDLIVLRSAGRWPTPAIQRFEVGISALLSMVAFGHGISLFAEESAAVTMANVIFLPIRDEPEPVTFSAVWSPRNRDPALMKFLELASALR